MDESQSQWQVARRNAETGRMVGCLQARCREAEASAPPVKRRKCCVENEQALCNRMSTIGAEGECRKVWFHQIWNYRLFGTFQGNDLQSPEKLNPCHNKDCSEWKFACLFNVQREQLQSLRPGDHRLHDLCVSVTWEEGEINAFCRFGRHRS